jgi:hypothetical protein
MARSFARSWYNLRVFWAMQFKSADPAAFLNAIAFWDEKNGIALGDPVKGLFSNDCHHIRRSQLENGWGKDLPAGLVW